MVLGRFDKLGYGISASECYPNVCVSEYVCNLAYLWGNVAHFLFLFMLVCSVVRFVLFLSGVLVFVLL